MRGLIFEGFLGGLIQGLFWAVLLLGGKIIFLLGYGVKGMEARKYLDMKNGFMPLVLTVPAVGLFVGGIGVVGAVFTGDIGELFTWILLAVGVVSLAITVFWVLRARKDAKSLISQMEMMEKDRLEKLKKERDDRKAGRSNSWQKFVD